jgi:hypothetical protein
MDENEKMIRLATEVKDENKNNLEAVDKESDETLEETFTDKDESCARGADGRVTGHCEEDVSLKNETKTPQTNWLLNGVVAVVAIAAAMLLRYLKFKMRDKINKA